MINTPNLHPKLSTAQLQQQNEEAEAWLAKHKPDLLNEEVFKVTPRNQHKHQLVAMHEKKAKQRFEKLLSSKDKVLAVCQTCDFITTTELAKTIGVSKPTLSRWHRLMSFPKTKTSKSEHLYCTKDLTEYFLKLEKENPCTKCKG